MTTSPYVRSARAYGEPAGIRLITALESLGLEIFTVGQAASQGASLGLTRSHTITLLHQLAVGGWLTRVKKGLYAINDPLTQQPRAHPYAIGASIVTPSAVSHWSALQHWGLTAQIPMTITLSSPTRTFPPTDEARGGERPVWLVAGNRYEFIAIARPRFFGVTSVWVSERDQVPIYDAERALLDTFQHFHVFGSLSVALEILEDHLSAIDPKRLAEYARRLGVVAVAKRVGWALEQVGVVPEVLEPLRDYPARGDSPLDPGRPARGRHNSTWNIIENLHDDE